MIYLLVSWILSLLLSLAFTPLAKRAALHAGIVDRPDGHLKVHTHPIPYLGGMALYLAFLITLSVVTEPDAQTLAVLIGSTLMVMLGLIDDIGSIPPWVKFTGQLLTVFVLVRSNIQVNLTFMESPTWLELFITFFWVVGICNAFNIIDIHDGLAAGIGALVAGALSFITYVNGQVSISLMAASLCGACLGFLYYNRPPATIYMGDSGSLFLGMTLGVLALLTDYSDKNPLALFSPTLIFAIPIFDTAYVIILRAYNRRPIFHGSRDHFAVRMRIAGWSTSSILQMGLGMEALFAIMGIYNIYTTPRFSLGLYTLEFIFFLTFGAWLARVPVDASVKDHALQERPHGRA